MSFEDLGSLRIKFSGDDLACLWLGFERAENMNVMREKLSQWEYLKQMPDEISGFIKKLPETFEVDGTCVPIFTYVLPSKYCRIEGYFDQSTDDFMVHCFIGLHVFHQIYSSLFVAQQQRQRYRCKTKLGLAIFYFSYI